MTQAAVPAGVQQEQLEAEERRRSAVLLLVGLAAVWRTATCLWL
jgi:hypothetical protein